ncbi:MAG: hypothetical protein IVW57_04190 [Ktedonobacterales bacterium]|nr:hypothetical protein [Ktedonobacterales bacterium]
MAVASHGSQAPPPPKIVSPTTTTPTPTTRASTRDETIRTTANHPWLTADRGWAQAGSLTLGERVVRADGGAAVVVALRSVAGTAPMWDLTVSTLHDFAVGVGQYVVHNCGGENDSFIGKRIQRRVDDSLLEPPAARGRAPIERATGERIEIHHVDQNPEGPFEEMTMTEHRRAPNNLVNHPIRNGSPVQHDATWRSLVRQYWEQEWDRGRWG